MYDNLSETRREVDRIFVTLPVTIRAGSEGSVVRQGNTVDYSHRGLRVRTDLPVLTSQKVEVILHNVDPQPKKYHVIWVRNPAKDLPTYEAGLKLAA